MDAKLGTNLGCYPNGTPTSGFSIDPSSMTGDITPNQSRALIAGWVPWDDLPAFAASIFPPSQIISGVLYQFLGQAYPGWPNLRATRMTFAPCNVGDQIDLRAPATFPVMDYTGTSIKLPIFNHARVEITYENVQNQPTNNDDPVPYLMHRWSLGGQTYTFGRGGAIWDRLLFKDEDVPVTESDPAYRNWIGVPVDSDYQAHFTVALIEHEITWPRVIRPPFTAIRDCYNKVNDDTVTFVTGSIPTECLLFLGGNIQTQILSDGSYAMELIYRFSERRVFAMDQEAPGGWNHFPYQGGVHTLGRAPYGSDAEDDECIFSPSGFYRLEKQVADPYTTDICQFYFIDNADDFTTGYQDATAIYPKADFSALFRPEP